MFELLYSFFFKQTPLFITGVQVRTSSCTFRQRQGRAGGVIAGAEWELPTGFSVAIRWLKLSSGQGTCVAQLSLKATLDMQWVNYLPGLLPCGSLTPGCRVVSCSGWIHPPIWKRSSFDLGGSDCTPAFTSMVQTQLWLQYPCKQNLNFVYIFI